MKLTFLQALVNPFANKESASPDNIEKKVTAKRDGKLEAAFNKYNRLEYRESDGKSDEYIESRFKEIAKLNPETLTPAQIDIFLNRVIKETKPWKLEAAFTGMYLSYLIQLSYNSGHNDFHLTTADSKLDDLLIEVGGSEKRRLKAHIFGQYCSDVGRRAKYLDLVVDGRVGHIGIDASYSSFNVNGDVSTMCGWASMYCDFVVTGDVDEIIGDSQHCTYTIEGKFSGLSNVRNCTFQTHNPETYEKMMASVKFKPRGNKVILLK